ncbi:MAG: site-2 protease family protein [Armatimonadetes bacterium]|nr:site-2 protease family protein [Armatimonadota bacterium]NIM23410.1 site-2 protease family protein [Armatimonadota bacterium]NIM67275.1 site-2 protease family protein [Armatimonadota bacterium]NIM75773.1 site-2 protease family protein [Armatimonadota bacterium]NIN05461.1 site-2 protease family protein [Armatimonadota bacterium]
MIDKIEILILTLPIFLLSISFHEYMHAWAADKLGDPTARTAGRLTINPRSHLDPVGLVMFILAVLFAGFFIGWAKPVPVNRHYFRQPRRDFALVSIAGPMANLIQAYVWYALLYLVLLVTGPFPSLGMAIVLNFLRLGVIVNIILLCFNLIPVPPLDGSRVLAWLLPARHAQVLDRIEPFGFFIILMLLWTGILGRIYVPMMQLVLWMFPKIGG